MRDRIAGSIRSVQRELMVVDGMPEGGKIHQLTGVPSAFTPDYAPEEMVDIATRLYKASRQIDRPSIRRGMGGGG